MLLSNLLLFLCTRELSSYSRRVKFLAVEEWVTAVLTTEVCLVSVFVLVVSLILGC